MSSKGNHKRNLTIFIFLLPTLIAFSIFSVFSISFSFLLSFTDWDILTEFNFIGFQNFINIVQSQEFWRVLKNTLYYIALYVPSIIFLSIGVALLLNIKSKLNVVFRTIFFIPVLTSWVAAAMVWKWFLSPYYGPVNALIGYFGIQGPNWLYDPIWAMPAIVLASLWKDLGFFSLIFLAGLQNIDPVYYEAAEIDGATKIEKFKNITFPLLSSSIFFVLILTLINSFQLFPQVMIMTKGGPYGATQVLMERIYTYAFDYYEMGYASAYSWILFIFILLVTIIQWKLQKRWVHYES
ncbi:sugar ABC transporter permease [Petrotoga sp. 8T1HF07.NaAc.6.1]|uniref:carbohydrate ABC transporter permease n=1 Tax=Petrotoga sp. 8T1HF07.NaAc.6.1 TaxID=1351838 RepID=UPI00192C6162|nr:sugar ABC transporter permease [Petrotoga sp. 8T1HF07.NaAc.6.1]